MHSTCTPVHIHLSAHTSAYICFLPTCPHASLGSSHIPVCAGICLSAHSPASHTHKLSLTSSPPHQGPCTPMHVHPSMHTHACAHLHLFSISPLGHPATSFIFCLARNIMPAGEEAVLSPVLWVCVTAVEVLGKHSSPAGTLSRGLTLIPKQRSKYEGAGRYVPESACESLASFLVGSWTCGV